MTTSTTTTAAGRATKAAQKAGPETRYPFVIVIKTTDGERFEVYTDIQDAPKQLMLEAMRKRVLRIPTPGRNERAVRVEKIESIKLVQNTHYAAK